MPTQQTPSPLAPVGLPTARIAFVTDTPEWESGATGTPPRGEAGRLLTRLLAYARLNVTDCWFDTVLPHPITHADLAAFLPQHLAPAQDALRLRLAALPDLRVIVPLGDVALLTLTGKNSLHKWRGSLLTTTVEHRQCKILPSLSPQLLLRQPDWTRRVLADFAKIADEAESPHPIHVPKQRTFIIYPSEPDIRVFEQRAASADVMALDIETNPASGNLLCVGFSTTDREALCIPWTTRFNQQAIRRLCALPCGKVFHNGLYDLFWLRWLGIDCPNWVLDTMFLHAVLEATEEHSLAHIASVYTDEPYWKDDAKDAKEGTLVKVYRPSESLYMYNARDAAVTREIADVLMTRAHAEQRFAFYETFVHALFAPLLDMMVTGIRVDEQERATQHAHLLTRIVDIAAQLETHTGLNLIGETALSPKKLQQYLYDTLHLPKKYTKTRTKNGARSLATDEGTLLKLIDKYPQKLGVSGPLLLEHRRLSQLSHFYAHERVDADGYFRFSLKPDTEAGRLSSQKSPLATGSNAQNISRDARAMYLPDPGHIFLEFDLSQVESRIVYVLSGDPVLIVEANKKPWRADQHTENAALLFDCKPEDVTKTQRHLGKITSHGAQRAMRSARLQETLMKAGYHYTEAKCADLLKHYYDTHPGILAYFQKIRWRVIKDRALTSSWGRRISWPFERLDDALFRKAYSFLPQAEAADFLNQRGLLPAYAWLQRTHMQSRLALTVHDSLLFSVAPAEAWAVACFVTEHLAIPLVLDGIPLSIPVEMSIGTNWQKSHAWQRFPSQDEFYAVLHSLSQHKEDIVICPTNH
jgi:uracil-DNA glycosylase family 4